MLPPRYNIAPTQPIAVVRVPRRLELLRWGLVLNRPRFPSARASGQRPPGGGINVRVESAARAPMYRDAFRLRRCLVVVDGFYEWKHADGRKQPFLIERTDRRPFALGGLWERSETPDGAIVESCAILTCAAAGMLAELHDRMPVVVPPHAYARWIDPAAHDGVDAAARWGGASGDTNLVALAVSPRVNNAVNDGVACVEPLADHRQ